MVPLAAQKKEGRFDLYAALQEALVQNGESLMDGDVLVISTKYVSGSQGRSVGLGGVAVSAAAAGLAGRFGMDPSLAELVIRESDGVYGGVSGFVIASCMGVLAPNAGIDKSNSRGAAVLYPEDPYGTAEAMRRKVYLGMSARVGVILADSRLMPARVGTTSVAVSCAGVEPARDRRAESDLDGNPLRVTFQATADSIATAANHEMGEGAESVPFVIARGTGVRLVGRRIIPSEAAVPADQCIYVRGLSGGMQG